jgi:peptidoglycan/xylan/chitin deacetylase (PgdA/CDA1 family)
MFHFRQTLKTRGILKTAGRLASAVNRYGLRPSRMRRILSAYTEQIHRPTLFVPAVILRKHPFLTRYGESLALHGYRHTDYSNLARPEQKDHLQRSLDISGRLIPGRTGFRAPFLKANRDTIELLAEMGFLYDSSCTYHWDALGPGEWNESYARILDHYRPLDRREQGSLPYVESGLLRIPVSLPDDEMLIDRMGIRDQDRLYRIWADILAAARRENEVFVLLLHPERFHMADRAVGRLSRKAEELGMWMASLGDIAAWWAEKPGSQSWPEGKKGVFCVTGDIDNVTLFDYFSR